MSKNILNLRHVPISLALCSFAFLAVDRTSAQLIGDRELLKQVATGYQANKERIKTWQGEAKVKDILDETNQDHRLTESNVTFVQDISNKMLRWLWSPRSIQQFRGTDVYVVEDRYGMLRDDLYYSVAISEPHQKRQPLTAVIYFQKERMPSWFSNEFNPMFYFAVQENDPAEHLMWYYKHAAELNVVESKTSVLKKDTLVILENTFGGNLERYTYDTAQGCNLVKSEGRDSQVTVEWTFQYENLGGVFLPTQITYSNLWKLQDGKTRFTGRTVTLKKNVLNKPIDPAEFSLDKLGLMPGEGYFDSRDQKWHEYKPISDPIIREVIKGDHSGQVQPDKVLNGP